jgi:hypothetical protein
MIETKTKAKKTAAKKAATKNEATGTTPAQLAVELKMDPRVLRRHLRLMAKEKKLDHGGRERWVFSAADIAKIKSALAK